MTKVITRRVWYIAGILLAYSALAFPQQDTSVARNDTSIAQRARPDTTKRTVSGVDTIVTYSASDSIEYSLITRTMTMHGGGDIKYREMQLKAEEIDINWDTAVMNARGVPDTAATDTGKGGKRYSGTPVMIDGGEEYKGFELSYNFRTQRGKINVGDTQIDQGYYHGEAIKKVDKDVLFVEDGRYTTCDAPEPHYYFSSPKMKVVMQDMVFAEPIYLYIADVPVFALPLGVFPNKRGRRSGIIAPAYGEDGRRGRYLSHLGYYWAMNDYMDWSLRGDGYSNGSWALYSDYRYAVRYSFGGSISANFRRYVAGEEKDPDRSREEAYSINFSHHQDFDPTTRMDVNFTFASNNSYLLTNNLQTALEQAIFSNATLSKYWEGTPNSMSINVSRSQYLVNGNITETLPAISFNRAQSFPFRSSKNVSGGSETAWYELIGYSYSAQFSNNRAKTSTLVGGIKTSIGGVDTTTTVEEFRRDNRQTLAQSLTVNASPKLGFFTITPTASFREDRTYSQNFVPQQNPADSSLFTAEQRDQLASGFFSTGISASTRLFGFVQPNALGVSAFRHTITPSVAFSYSKQVYGRNLPPKQMLASFSLGNIFEMKTIPSVGDSAVEGRKIQLMNVNAGVSYNFSADSLNFSPIALSFRTDIANLLNISGGSSFDLYKFDESIGRPVNRFLIKEEGRLARMTSFSLNLSTSLSGERSKSTKTQTGAEQSRAEGDTTAGLRESEGQKKTSGYYGIFQEEEPDLSIPWSLQLAWDFFENKVPGQEFRTSNLRGNLGFNLTEHWKISASGSYDVINRQIAAPSVTIYRDLHCWEMNFTWVPLGTYRHFQLEIRLKAPQLQDIKITKQRSSRNIY